LSASTDHATPSQCENCGTALQGHYCHVCGQRAHNPLKHATHALEEVLESFWHLDGRVFRTLGDLFVPGRVAANYIAGHRVRYIPPLRLFIILSVITFFVGKLTLHFDPSDAVRVDTDPSPRSGVRINTDDGTTTIRDATSIEDVLQKRAEALAALEKARNEPEASWAMTYVGGFAERRIEEHARARMRELGATPAQMRALDGPPSDGRPDASGTNSRNANPTDRRVGTPGAMAVGDRPATDNVAANMERQDTRPANPASRERGFFHDWLEHRMLRLKENAELIQKKPDEFVRLVLGAAPGALFLLLPLFALCLKLLYWRSRRGYLEHVVVALYSHAMLLVALLITFLLVGLQGWSATPVWLREWAAFIAAVGLSIAMPLYLLWMQKRVYAQGWFKTSLKFILIGSVYSVLLSFAMLYAVLAGLSS
jgi:hypothetical protein